MKKFSKILMLLVIIALFAFSACGNNDPTPPVATPAPPTPQGGTAQNPPPAQPGNGLSPNNPVTISTLIVTPQLAPEPGNRITQLLLDRLGVTLTYDLTPPDLLDQRIGVLIAGGDLPDLLGVPDGQARLVQARGMLRLDPFLDSGQWPLLLEHIRPYRQRLSWRGGGVEDGLYQFPNYNRFYGNPPMLSPEHWGSAFWIQKAVLEWHNFPSLDNMTLERYFNMIEEYMTAHPYINGMPTIGFTFPTSPGHIWGMTNPPLFLAGHPNNGSVMVFDGIARIYGNTQYAEDYFRFLNRAHARGIVDPETFTQTLDQYLANLASGRVLGMHDQRWAFSVSYDALVSAGLYNRTWVGTMPVFPGRTPWYADRDVMNVHQGMGISSMANNPELLLTFLETMMTEEWQILLSWGEEGIDYNVDADGMFYRTPEQVANRNDITWRGLNRLEAFLDQLPKLQGTLSCGNSWAPGHQLAEFQRELSDYNRIFLDAYGKSTWRDFFNDPPNNPVYYPAWQISLPAGSPAAIAESQLEDIAVERLPGIIMGSTANFDAAWAAYIAMFDMINVAAYEAAITAGLQERIELAGGL